MTIPSSLIAATLAGVLASAAIAQDSDDDPYITIDVPLSLSNLTQDTFAVAVECHVVYPNGEALGTGKTYLMDTTRDITAWTAQVLLPEEEPNTRETVLEGFSGTVAVFVTSHDPVTQPIDAWGRGLCELSVLALVGNEIDMSDVYTRTAHECGPAPIPTAANCMLPGSESIGSVEFVRDGFELGVFEEN